jgi:prepilin-type N-terminal cleavage/methylation domain-containing protein
MMRIRAVERPSGDDAGFTLVELLVTMLITGIVLSMIGVFFANVARLTSWSGNDRRNTGQAALALDEIRAVVRVAVDNPTSGYTSDPSPIAAATASSLTVYAYSNTTAAATAPTKVGLSLVTDTSDGKAYLVETRQGSTYSSTTGYWTFSGATTSRRIAGPFSLTGTPTFFTYLDNKNATVPIPASGIAAAGRKVITFVRVTTTVDQQGVSGNADPVVVSSSIGMPNVVRDVAPTITAAPLPTPTPTPTPTRGVQ